MKKGLAGKAKLMQTIALVRFDVVLASYGPLGDSNRVISLDVVPLGAHQRERGPGCRW
jgi:hypothetical protein